MIDLENNTIDLELFKNVLKEIKNSKRTDIIDSFSDNQFKSKLALIALLDKHNLITENSLVTILGCWYGSILVSLLSPRVDKIIPIDLDDNTVRIAKNKLFSDCANVSWSTGDVFDFWRGDLSGTDLLINTSCEHMLSMKYWPYWHKMKSKMCFAFQSNNMYGINGHINCVDSVEHFKNQLPDNCVVLDQHELVEERGTRFTLVGKTQ